MAIFQSDARALLKRLADKTYESSQERDQLLAQLAAVEGLKARDVAWMLFRPDRAYRDAVVGVLKRIADPETADVVMAECKGKPEAAVRAAAADPVRPRHPGHRAAPGRAGDARASPRSRRRCGGSSSTPRSRPPSSRCSGSSPRRAGPRTASPS